MDLKKLSVPNTGRLHLRDASEKLLYTEDKKPVVAVLYSPASKEFAQAQANRENLLVDKLRQKGSANATVESKRESKANYLADCTHSFENVEYENLKGRDLFFAVYSDSSIGFLSDQVNAHLSDWSNFTKG